MNLILLNWGEWISCQLFPYLFSRVGVYDSYSLVSIGELIDAVKRAISEHRVEVLFGRLQCSDWVW